MLKFQIKDEFADNYGSIYAKANDEFSGIKRYNIFVFAEEINMPVPIETFYDVENNTVYTNVSLNGTYFVMDVEKCLSMMGIEPTTERTYGRGTRFFGST